MRQIAAGGGQGGRRQHRIRAGSVVSACCGRKTVRTCRSISGSTTRGYGGVNVLWNLGRGQGNKLLPSNLTVRKVLAIQRLPNTNGRAAL